METSQAIASFLATRKLKGLTNQSIQQYEFVLGKFAQEFPSLPKNHTLIQSYLSNLPGGQYYKAHIFTVLNSFFNWIHEEYNLESPMKHIPRPKCPNKVVQTLGNIDIFLLLSLVENNPRDKAVIYLLLDTGIRRGELANFKWTQIDNDFITVSGKVGQRIVPISEITHELLLALPRTDDYVFHNERGKRAGKPLTEKGIYFLVSKCFKSCGYTGNKRGSHVLRHTFGRWFLVNGGDLRSLQLILGHKDIKTTEKYASLAMSDVIKKHHAFSPLVNQLPVRNE